MAKKINMLHMAEMLESAANTGSLEFDKITYEQWLAFLKKHSSLKTITFGRPDPEFVQALKDLALLAREFAEQQPPELSKAASKLLNKFDSTSQVHGWEKDQGTHESSMKAEKQYVKAKTALSEYIANLERSVGVK